MIDYHTPRFKSSEVAKAAGMTINNFRSHFKRGNFRMLGKTDVEAGVHGLPHLFSLRDAMGFAVATALIDMGLEAKPAWEIAMIRFAHTGDENRDTAGMYNVNEFGFTLLVQFPETGEARIIPSDDFSLYEILRDSHDVTRTRVRLLVLNYIEMQVFHALDINTDGGNRDEKAVAK